VGIQGTLSPTRGAVGGHGRSLPQGEASGSVTRTIRSVTRLAATAPTGCQEALIDRPPVVTKGETEKLMSERELRPRRSNLAVPGSSPKMLEKAKGLPADQVFLDIEDAVAPL